MPSPPPLTGPLSLRQLAQQLGTLRHAELSWAETLGTWMRDATDPEAKVALAASSDRRAAHASLLAARLPTYRPTPTGGADDVEITPATATDRGPGAAELVAPTADDGLPAQLAAFYRAALPRLLVEYRTLLATVDARVDGPTHRVLTQVTTDGTSELAGVESLLRRLDVSDG